MIKNELFFHYQTPKGRSLGFSALMMQDKDDPLVAWIAITRCNKHDKSFNKKIAREVLRNRALQAVRVKDIPKLFAEEATKCGLSSYNAKHFNNIMWKFL